MNHSAPPRIERRIGSHELPVITTSLKRILYQFTNSITN